MILGAGAWVGVCGLFRLLLYSSLSFYGEVNAKCEITIAVRLSAIHISPGGAMISVALKVPPKGQPQRDGYVEIT